MKVSEALASRVSIRDFLPTPVPGEAIRRVLATAARAPSGGNLQPWHIDVVGGEKLDELRAIVRERITAGIQEQTDYAVYPQPLGSPYRERRFKCGEDMYRLLDIPREDKPARLRWFARNFEFFGAPLALFCSVDRGMGAPQWSDLGMFLQSVMLMLREEGLDSCAQECWSRYPETIGRFIDIPPERMLFAGMSIGYRNPEHPVNSLVTDRAPLEEFVHFHGA
ncbi:MAG: nitroreductase [Burkholderiaceae bacterium]|nr:nitroreductase [Burkholderiaceae bacterium]MEB2318210.1 nitroreductase [Pseudomonadota bacterium]